MLHGNECTHVKGHFFKGGGDANKHDLCSSTSSLLNLLLLLLLLLGGRGNSFTA